MRGLLLISLGVLVAVALPAWPGRANPPSSPPSSPPGAQQPPRAASAKKSRTPKAPTLADAPKVETESLLRMLKDEAWPRRAIAALRLERYGCAASQTHLERLLRDPTWQVRAFAIRSLARRHVPAQEQWFADESEPRVLRAALRYRYSIDPQRLSRGVQALARQDDLKSKMLAAELGAASGDPELQKLAIEAAKLVILRMNRTEAGVLSSRLAALTGQYDLHRPYQWQNWLMRRGRQFRLEPAYEIADAAQPLEPSPLAQLEPEQFAGLENYMAALSEHQVDLAICLDCTASMGREIAAAQSGIDDMMLFVGDVVSSLRIALVAYRDRGDEFETKAWEFTSDIAQLRQFLWQLSADGGGDEPEAVYPAMQLAFTKLQWRDKADKVLVVVGDAPPHVGFGGLCVDMAKRARETAALTTHVVQAKGKAVKHFPEIAEAGGGRCVSLKDADTLMAEITGLTLGDRFQDEFREFFRVYLELCR